MVEWERGAGGGQLSEMESMKTDTPPMLIQTLRERPWTLPFCNCHRR